MKNDKVRVLMVEDKGSERSMIKSFLKRPEFREQFDFYFWGERPDEPFECAERQVQQFIETHQETFDVIVLDHCWTSDEEDSFRVLQNLSLQEIRQLPDGECPSSVRLLRLLQKSDLNALPVLVFTWFGFPRWSRYVQQVLGADWTMHKERQDFEDLFRQILGIHRFSQKLMRAQFADLTGSSQAILDLRIRMKEALRSEVGHIFLSGPAGSGKELVARILGKALAGDGPYVPFAASAMPETLVEAELFGRIAGYLDSRSPAIPGAFRSAEGGVLFLDEILSLPVESQPKLLRALGQDVPEIQVLGGGTVAVNVRLILATNYSFHERIAAGRLTPEFAQRIEKCFTIQVPALSDRADDIPDLAKVFCREASEDYFRYGIAFSDGAIEVLQQADWSNGNVRALRACVRDLVGAPNSCLIEAADVHDALKVRSDRPGSTSRRMIQIPEITKDGVDLLRIEREAMAAFLSPILEDALRISRFQTSAASLLGLTPDQLKERLKKCGIDPKDYRS